MYEVLQHINSGAYVGIEDLIVFGTEDIEEVLDPWKGKSEHSERLKEMRTFVSECKQEIGQALASRRTSLQGSKPSRDNDFGDEQLDNLDAHYASELLLRLEKIVRRAAPLQPMEKVRLPSEDTQAYFQEAMRCYLYGFSTACSVLCRAILESALKEVIDPIGRF